MVKEYKERQRKDFLVSVIIPVFNEEVTVGDVVTRTKKTLEKMGVRYEVLVVDDGSDDRGVELILGRYKESDRIKLLAQEHRGSGAAMNYGASRARGEYICRLDSDDLLFPQALEVVNAYIEKFPNVDYFYSSRCTIDEEDRLIETFNSVTFDRKRLLRRNIANHFICWRKQSFLEVGGFDETIRYGEDCDLALRMAEKFRFQNIEEVLYKVRRGPHKDRITSLFDQEERGRIVAQSQQRAKQRMRRPQNRGGEYGGDSTGFNRGAKDYRGGYQEIKGADRPLS